jgi:hypothetical protein
MGWMMDQTADWILKVVLDAFLHIMKVIGSGFLITPDVTGMPQVEALTSRSVWVVDSTFVLVFVAAGLLTMTAGGSERVRYEVKDLIPRAVVGFIAAHFSPLFVGNAIKLTNVMVGVFGTDSLDKTGALPAITGIVQGAGVNAAAPVLTAIFIVVVTVLLCGTMFGLLTRIAILLVLAAVAPIALALHALPQTDPIARLWWQSLGGCLVTPVLQAFCLQAGTWMLIDPKSMYPSLGFINDPLAVANLMVVILLLYITVKVPKLVKRYLVRGAPPHNMFGVVIRSVVVTGGARLLGIPKLAGGGR